MDSVCGRRFVILAMFAAFAVIVLVYSGASVDSLNFVGDTGQQLLIASATLPKDVSFSTSTATPTSGASPVGAPGSSTSAVSPAVGYETCARFRMTLGPIPPRPRPGKHTLSVGVAGLMNTGTNYLSAIMNLNCVRHSVSWQVPWGKHERVESRGTRFTKAGYHNVSLVMPIVLVRDPLNWMKSMCKKSWSAHIDKRHGCPSPVQHTKTKFLGVEYQTLLHLWNEWNRAYLDLKHPRVMVRYEDVLLKPAEAVKNICECGSEVRGGESWSFHDYAAQISPGKAEFNHSANLQRQRDPLQRFKGYSQEDLTFVKDNIDRDLARILQYDDGIV